MIFVKLQNGNVKVTTAGGDTLIGINDTGVRCMVVGPSGDIIQIMQDNYPIFTFNVSEVTAYQILPAASVAFAGTAPQFVDILMADFFLAEIDATISGTVDVNVVSPNPLPVSGTFTPADEGTDDPNNSSTAALLAGATFTGIATDVKKYPSVVVACLTDQNGTLQVQFSPDGVNWDSTIPYTVTANTNEVHRITVTRRYFRVIFTNGSVNQTFFRLQTLLGKQTQITSALNSVVQSDSDTLLVRPLDFNLMVSEGLYQNRSVTIKDGINFDIDAGSVPEDIWDNGGVYTGFVTTAAAAELVVAGADTGTVFYSYMSSAADTNYTFASIAIAGAGTYPLGHNIYRCNFAYFVASTSVFNVGIMTIRHTATPTNIFVTIPVGFSQSYCAAYTVPAGGSAYIDRVTTNLRGSVSGNCDGYFYYNTNTESPRLRFPHEYSNQLYFDDIDYLIRLPALTDIVPRITFASTNNLTAKISYRIILVRS